jgi:flagellar assembly factor FliW
MGCPDTEETLYVKSTKYGELTFHKDQVYRFPQGLIGLPHLDRYALFPFDQTDFFILQALSEDISFILIPAATAKCDYSFEIDQGTIELLDIQKPEDVATFFIVNVIEDQIYINAKAPILLVPSSQLGCQYVVNETIYSIREPLRREDESQC